MSHSAAKKNNDAVQNINALTLAFAKAAAKNQEDKTDNLIVSPYNALTCLAMVAEGAAGNTREELAKTLFGCGAEELNARVTGLAALNNDILAANQGKVDLKTANGVWVNNELLTLNQKYADKLKKEFGAEISGEAFSDPHLPAKINGWAKQNTNNLIDNIVEKLDANDFAVLASALYFKGSWTHKFDKEETKDRSFTMDDGVENLTPVMHKVFKSGDAAYQDGEDYQAVALTYGEAKPMRLILVRPKDENVSARDWLSQQAGAEVPDVYSGCEASGGKTPSWMAPAYAGAEASVTVELPRLDIKQKHDLIPVLKEMGIRDAFADAADFSPMTEDGSKELYVGKVSHDVVFKTDEEGSEAAAVTAVTMMKRCAVMPEKAVEVKFDRSFVFALQDVSTGAVIFAGAVNKPNNCMKPLAISQHSQPAKQKTYKP